MLQARSLTKSFSRKVTALDDVSFEVREGDIFGLLGHNGAGKSTALGIMLGLVRPNRGEVFVDGVSVQRSPREALRKVGAIFESPVFWDYLSGWRCLRILAQLSGPWDESAARDVVELVGLSDRIGDPVRTYSHGMRQRLALAQALLPAPKVLLLDEPTDGLDPEGIREFRELALRLRSERGITILLNSHLLAEIELMCTRFAVLRRGRLVYEGDGGDLRAGSNEWDLDVDNWPRSDAVLARLGVTRAGADSGRVIIPADCESADVVAALVEAGVRVQSIAPVRRSLEMLYLAVTSGDPDASPPIDS